MQLKCGVVFLLHPPDCGGTTAFLEVPQEQSSNTLPLETSRPHISWPFWVKFNIENLHLMQLSNKNNRKLKATCYLKQMAFFPCFLNVLAYLPKFGTADVHKLSVTISVIKNGAGRSQPYLRRDVNEFLSVLSTSDVRFALSS